MLSRDLLDRLVTDQLALELPDPTPRAAELAYLPGKADVVIGMRGSGKTGFLFQEMHRLLEQGRPRERVLYVDFEDERLLPLEADELHQITDTLERLHPDVSKGECWYFFDEIHNVKGWERFVRRLLSHRRLHVALTGSSAKLLSREVATSLRGRGLTTELLPFDFGEYLRHRSVEVPERWPPPASTRRRLESAFRDYIEIGGFPEVQGVPPATRVRVLQEYLNVALFRDVVERRQVSNIRALRWMVRRLAGSPAGRLTVNRMYNDLKSQGLAASKATLHEYLAHLEDAFLLFLVPQHGRSQRARMVNPRKVYLVDPALGAAISYRAGDDLGHRLENVVYLALREPGRDICYYETRKGREVDFFVRGPGSPARLLQVCADLTDHSTRERELGALEEAMTELRLEQAEIVTLEHEETIETDTGVVRAVPAWRWLLEEPSA